ncbi:hypothetical protein [Alkalihalophilus marmarensis]|uniref:hypothetical protein n=1 Tax=Alkalihalophilus marmarensis TaxID=521377 RepID=UPI002DBCD912|nr:hypothetical protein [Alkalihalophilus marmarensis]MEC2074437.1 hypothetical protein [Alkalihalophilus marmarensis]
MINQDLCLFVLEKVDLKIKKSINSIPKKYQEEVEQDLKEKICNSLYRVNKGDTPGFFDFLKKNN